LSIYADSESRQIPNQFNGYTDPNIVQFILFLKILREDWSLIIINTTLLRSAEREPRDSDLATTNHRRDWDPDKVISGAYLRIQHRAAEDNHSGNSARPQGDTNVALSLI
jgi:hypothetical protein